MERTQRQQDLSRMVEVDRKKDVSRSEKMLQFLGGKCVFDGASLSVVRVM
jgi:hypothetical protein